MTIVVAGSGPAGLTYALRLADLQASGDVVLLEEHRQLGYPPHCTGLVSLSTLQREYPKLWKEASLTLIEGANIRTRHGVELHIGAGKPIAAVLDRRLFEELLGKAVEASGVTLRLGARVKSVDPSRRKGVLEGGEVFSYDILALATGATAPLNAVVGLERPKGLLPAVNAEYQLKRAIEHRYVYVYLDSRVAPGFFAWIVPLSEYRVRVGLGAASRPLERLKLFEKLDPFGINLSQARRLQVYGGLVLTGGPLKKYYSGRVVAIGDSAGHTKPTTGGGIAFASIAARLLAQASVRADSWDDVGPLFQAGYNKILQREVRLMLLARRLASSINDVQISKLLGILQSSGVVDEIAKGHMDFHGGVLVALAKRSLETKPVAVATILLQALLRLFF